MYHLNFRMVGGPIFEIKIDIEEIFEETDVAFRMNYGFGFVFYDEDFGRYSNFHASSNSQYYHNRLKSLREQDLTNLSEIYL